MDEKTIRIIVTQERFEEIVSLDDAMNLSELNRKELYDYLVQFVKSDNGYLSVEDARKLFKKIPAKEMGEYISQFYKAISDAYVSPRNGGTSEGQS